MRVDTKWPRAAWVLVISLSMGLLPLAWAAETRLTLDDLGVQEDIIHLPTRNAARELRFTVPRTWQSSAPPVFNFTLQHSDQLDPSRSRLEVLLNDRVLKVIPLTASNATATGVSVPLSASGLLDINRLTLRVEQHLPQKCEDPLDKALWTQIVGTASLTLKGEQTLAALDFAKFPAPLVNSLAFSHLPIDYQINGLPSEQDLTALLRLQSRLAQTISNSTVHHTAKLPLSVSNSAVLSPKAGHHQILLGSAYGWDDLQVDGGTLRYSRNGWTWDSGSLARPLNETTGVLAMRPNPASPHTSVQLLISGNSPKAVLRAVEYLLSGDLPTLRPDASGRIAIITPDNWQPSRSASDRVAYLKSGMTTFAQLGLPTVGVEKITAPPITHEIANIYRLTPEAQHAALKAVFSYGPGLNPRYSSVEFRLNDRSLGSAPLDNPRGESRQTLTVPIPVDLVGVNNRLVTQFHLAPDKYGFCKDDYVDKSWAKLESDSAIELVGVNASVLPNLGALISGAAFSRPTFPASSEMDFSKLTIGLVVGGLLVDKASEAPSSEVLSVALALADKLGRALPKGVTPAFEVKLITDARDLDKSRQTILVSSGPQTDAILKTLNPEFQTQQGLPSGVSGMRWHSSPTLPVRLWTQSALSGEAWLTVVSGRLSDDLTRLVHWLSVPESALPDSDLAFWSGSGTQDEHQTAERVILGAARHQENTSDWQKMLANGLANGWQWLLNALSGNF